MGTREIGEWPEHLAPLLEPRPAGAAKLTAAWEGLATETQIRLLEHIPRISYPRHLIDPLWRMALNSPNAYVRYLAARSFSFDDGDPDEKKGLAIDASMFKVEKVFAIGASIVIITLIVLYTVFW